jgi:parvulin-like peptidyl-prolyl isomerase
MALLLLVHTTAFAQKDSGLPTGFSLLDRIVAVVDNEVITDFELERKMSPLAGVGFSILDDKEREEWFKTKRVEVLNEAVNTILVIAEAKKLDLEISPTRIAGHLNTLRSQNGWSQAQLVSVIRKMGFPSLENYREHVEREMLKAQMISIKVGSRAKASKDDVARVFKRDYYGGKAEDEIRAQHILIKVPPLMTQATARAYNAKAHRVRNSAMAEEKSFAELAREFSDDKNASLGGELGWFTRGLLEPTFERAAFALQAGKISEVIQTRFGYHIIRVMERRKKPIFDAGPIKRRIQMDLEIQNRLKGYESWVQELRLSHHVDVRL